MTIIATIDGTRDAPTPADLETEIRRLIALQAQIAELADEAEHIKGWLREHLGDRAQVDLDGRRVLTITPTRRLDEHAASQLVEKMYGADVAESCWSTVRKLDAAKVKDLLPAALLDARCYSDTGKATVRLAR